MSGLRRTGLMMAAAGALALGGCQTTMVEELNAAGERLDRAARAPVLALHNALENAGEALKGPDLSPEAQKAYGDRLTAQAFQRLPMAHDDTLEQYLSDMANRLASQSPGPNFTYRVYLVDAKEANAFTPGGGHIFVTTGLVHRLDNEAQMAMVLGHEIAHSINGHVIKTAQRREISKRAVAWVGSGLGMAANAAVNLYTHDQEDQADEMGLDLMVAAGYDLREAENAIRSLVGDGSEEEVSLGKLLFGDHSSKSRRLQRMLNVIVAKYSHHDTSGSIRTTAAYEQVSLGYR